MIGWIKLHRKITEKGYYNKSEYVHLWIHLLLKAHHKPKEFMFNNTMIQIKEGQFLTGRKQLSADTGIAETTIERILNMLESGQQIEQQKTNKFRIITIVNWKEYQSGEQQADNKRTTSGQQADNKRTTSGQQADTNKNIKKEKKGKKKPLVVDTYFSNMIPDSLKTIPEFINIWKEWVDARREDKKPLTERAVKMQLKFLTEQSNPVAVITNSIQNQYRGLFPVNSKNGKYGKPFIETIPILNA